jgi:hypothetical protein
MAVPLALLLVQIAWVHHELVASQRVKATLVPDTQSYINHAQMSTINGALMHYRSLGYPAAIRWIGWRELPGRELWLFFIGAVALFAGVTAYARSAWVGLAAAMPLLHGQTLELLGRIQPDFISCGLVLLVVALLLLLVGRRRNPVLWLGLLVSVFAAYQMRPATLFLLGWLPAVGWLLVFVRQRTPRGPALGFALALVAATWLPYLAFAGWRYARIGEFGLVGFGGYNMSGLAASLVDESMLDELEGRHRRMARQMLNMRRRRGWEPYRPGEGSQEWFEQYNDNLWRVGVQTAKQQIVVEEGSLKSRDPMHESLHLRINELLRDASKDIIRRRLDHYVVWVKDANLYGWKQLPDSPWVRWPALLLAASAAAVFLTRRLGALRPPASNELLAASLALLAAGVSYFVAYTLLISLLSFPFSRYYYGSILLLPSGLCAVLAALWLQVAASRGSAQRSITAETSGASRGGGEA